MVDNWHLRNVWLTLANAGGNVSIRMDIDLSILTYDICKLVDWLLLSKTVG